MRTTLLFAQVFLLLAINLITGCGAEISASRSSSSSSGLGAGTARPRITPRPDPTTTSIPDESQAGISGQTSVERPSPKSAALPRQLQVQATFQLPQLSSATVLPLKLEHLAVTPQLSKGLKLMLAEAREFELISGLNGAPASGCTITPNVLELSASSENLPIDLIGTASPDAKAGKSNEIPACLEALMKLRSQGFTIVFKHVPLYASPSASSDVPEGTTLESVTIVASPEGHSS